MSSQPASWLLGIDIGGTKLATLLVDPSGRPVASHHAPTDLTSPEATLQCVIGALKATLADAAIGPREVAAIGMGIPGQIDPERGMVNLAVNLGWHSLPVGPLVSAALGVPCVIENDVRAAALGVHRFHNPAQVASLAYVSVGTGIAAGIVLDGALYRGAHGMAGEIGHVPVAAGPRCACGALGCLEALAAGPAIAAAAAAELPRYPRSLLQRAANLSAREVYAAAAQDDTLALSVVRQVGRLLGRALHQFIMTIDVAQVLLGGGVAQARMGFLQPILDEWAALREQSLLARTLLDPSRVQLLAPDYHAGAWGAVALAEQALPPTLPRLPARRFSSPSLATP